jgi:hypothetical protein
MISLANQSCAIAVTLTSLTLASGASAGVCSGTSDIAEGAGSIETGASLLCYGADTSAQSFGRMHDLSQTELAGTSIEIHCVTWTLEWTSSSSDAAIRVYSDDDGIPGGSMTFQGEAMVAIPANSGETQLIASFDPPLYVDAHPKTGSALVFVELSMPSFSEAPAYNIAANTQSQSSPSWIYTGGECGINDWTNLADIGYPGISWVESMNASPSMGPDPCEESIGSFPADIDDDMDCDVDDLLALLSTFGDIGDGTFRPNGDIHPMPNGDCDVDVDDLLTLLSNFGVSTGACCIEAGGSSICYDHQTQASCEAKGDFATWLGSGSVCQGSDCGSGGGDGIMLNELRANQSGDDTDEYFELIGDPGASLDGLTLIAIGDGSSDSPNGIIEEAVDLNGLAINAAGFFVVGGPKMLLGTPDYAYELNFESGDQVTFMLVSGFTGAMDDDLDTDDDGVLDTMPWDAVLDCVAFIEEADEYSDHVYCTTTAGPDGVYAPGGARKCPDADGDWYDNGFYASDFVDTPGLDNYCDFTDTDGDGVIDGQDNCPELANPDQADCDGDGIGDLCAIADGLASDCNENTIPDNCEDDCNFNGSPDDCDVANGTSDDCNQNGIPDECEADCNNNGINDECDIANGTSEDTNDNGVPDECEGEAFVINEINADPSNANDYADGDANGDGIGDYSDDEFVEIVNMTSENIFMGGWQIHDAVALRHTIAADVVLGPGCSLVVFGGGDPLDFGGDFGGAVIEVASTGYLGLNNSGDTVSLLDADGTIVLEVTYGSEGGDNQSITRFPDVYGESFFKHSLVAADGALFSPGTTVNGASFGGDCGGGGGLPDADDDGVPDKFDNCDLYNPNQADCNENGIGDVCDIADGTSEDLDENGIPDECEVTATGAYINELHYDNVGSDVDEMIEVVLLDGLDPSTVTVTLYNGNGSAPYNAFNVAGDFTAGDSGATWAIYSIILPSNGLQNGSPDGLCIDIDGMVAEFLSYEGEITAGSGPATGMTSMDIGVEEGSGTSIGSSLGLTGSSPFAWAVFADLATPGMVNDGQTMD